MKRAKLFRNLLVLLALIGFVVASIALYYHFDDSGEAFCDVSDQFNCSTVYSSQYSYILGVPVPLFGMFAYAFVIFAILNQRRVQKMLSFSEKDYWLYGAIIISFMLLFQCVMTLISTLFIKSYCILCLISQATVLLLAIGAWTYWSYLKK